jgi:Protein of unknown function (DUF2637)
VSRRGRGWAYLGLVLGGAASIAGNVTHTVLTPAATSSGIIVPLELRVPFAVIAPVFLAVGIEVLTRVPWRRNWRHWVVRVAGVLPIAIAAAVVSFDHLHNLALLAGETKLVSIVLPVAIDGLMVMCAVALLLTVAGTSDTPGQSGRTLAQRVRDVRTSVSDIRTAARGHVPDIRTSEVPDTPDVRMSEPADTDTSVVRIPRVRVRRPAGRPVSWDRTLARTLIGDTLDSDVDIARRVFGPDATDTQRRRITRLRQEMRVEVNGSPID